MKLIYPVKWKELWRFLTKYMTIAIISTVVVGIVIRFVTGELTYDMVFRHLSPLVYVGLLFGIFAFCFMFAGLIALIFKLASITIENGRISGRNYWGFKRTIPFDKIEALRPFSNNGITALIVVGGKHGNVFIYTHTDGFSELIDYIERNMFKKSA